MAAVSDREITGAETTDAFFQRLADLGFECMARDHPRRGVRRVDVTCVRGERRLAYAGGFSPGNQSFTVDRIHLDEALIGGRRVGEHVRRVLDGGDP
jgi:hypothetical protein